MILWLVNLDIFIHFHGLRFYPKKCVYTVVWKKMLDSILSKDFVPKKKDRFYSFGKSGWIISAKN